jgi:hypothetical protein
MMTKQLRTSLKLAFAAALAISPSAFAATTQASSSGTVVAPIAITKAADMAFGSFAAASGGSVIVSTSGIRTFGGGVLAMGGTPAAAKFDVTGEGTATYTISVVGDATLISGADTMAFEVYTDLTGANATTGTVALGALTAGAQSIVVGGKLTVAGAQPTGTYTGNITATVEYN